MSIASNFPNIVPSLSLDFAAVQALDPRITFTRASTATYYGTQTAKAEENLLIQSQTFNLGGWAATGGVLTGNATVAPDGTTTAELFTANITGTSGISQVITTGTIPHTFSVFAKAGTCSFVRLLSVTGTNAVWFDLVNGTVGTVQGSTTATISNAGNGWFRCSVTVSVGGTTAFIRLANADASTAANDTTTIELWGAQLEQRSAVTAYTPTTAQPITNYIPQLLTAASGVARFDHNPTTFESLGLEIEESRANLILQSEDLDTTWAETRATLALNSVIAPSGALTADGLIASTDNNTHFTSQTFTGTAAAHTFSVYAKAYGLNHVALRLFNGATQVGLAYYNLSTGATGTVTAGTAAITSVGNGWYRCALTATLAASASCTADIQLANADNTNSFAGNAFSGVTLWGTQVELGAFATSYIPTVASQVTRAADAASMTGTNFSSWYNAGQGALYAEYVRNGLTSGASPFGVDDGSTNNRLYFVFGFAAPAQQRFDVLTNNSGQAAVSLASGVVGTLYKAAASYAFNDIAASQDGSAVATDLSATIPVVTQARIIPLNGTIRKLSYYPQRLSNTNLVALTS